MSKGKVETLHPETAKRSQGVSPSESRIQRNLEHLPRRKATDLTPEELVKATAAHWTPDL